MAQDCKLVLNQFKDQYFQKTNDLYEPTYGRDLKIFKDMVNKFGFDKTISLIEIYFTRKAQFYSPVFVRANLNQLLELWRKQNPIKVKMVNRSSERFNNE